MCKATGCHFSKFCEVCLGKKNLQILRETNCMLLFKLGSVSGLCFVLHLLFQMLLPVPSECHHTSVEGQ